MTEKQINQLMESLGRCLESAKMVDLLKREVGADVPSILHEVETMLHNQCGCPYWYPKQRSRD